MEREKPHHWLQEVASRASLAGADGLSLERSVAIEEAWERVARGCGISQDELAQVVAETLNLKVADLQSFEPNIIRLVPHSVAKKYLVLPLRESYRSIIVACADPTDIELEQMVRFSSGRDPRIEVAPPREILEAVEHSYSSESAVEVVLRGMNAEGTETISVIDEAEPEEGNLEEEASAAPVIKLASLVIRDAVRQRASDIHIESGYTKGTIRFRVDGVLRRYMQMPMPALKRIISRVKILGKMDIADRLRPQDGRARVLIDNFVYDLRISTVPTGDSEKLVVRILNSLKTLNLKELQVPEPEGSQLRELLDHRNSLVIVTGPTGSGKTTTLYAALKEIATTEVNVITVEDPVEYDLPGITQIQVAPRQGVTFASALRSILRQDPDVILIGEIRDLETARIAVQAAMTGHLVFATLHTKDAASAIERLTDLGLDRSAIASSLQGIVAQRLVRSICEECGEELSGEDLTPEEEDLGSAYRTEPRIRAVGCSRCDYTGYRGRIPVLEVLNITPPLRRVITRGEGSAEIEALARSRGFRSMREVALDRVKRRETTLQEVDRVVGGRGETDTGTETGSGHRILVVDDDPVIRTQARKILEKNDFLVSEAEDGVVAMDVLKTDSEVSLVVTDLRMPRMEGGEMLTRLREDRATAGLPVIVLTGSPHTETEAELIERGADDYIRKPIDPSGFVARIKATLRRAA